MGLRLSTGSASAAAIAAALVGLPSAPANALPVPVTTAQAVAGEAPLVGVHYTGWRHRHYRHRHHRYVRYYRPDPGLAVAGAALGLLGAVAARPRYRYYDSYYYGGYYPASYGYYPTYSYSYGYPYYGDSYRRAYWGGGPAVVHGYWYSR